ncbi:sulfotransferase family protein [Chachezhania antarctica]|uniref:sulfotransferase family protein n=1 Tax=Chachezhania antarctica TaxID=2340860 RepID=UPI0013CEE31F|nr:sulfotransferase family protein [Chachezhania antarctica]
MYPQIQRQALRANKAANIVYLNNPKVGCSTIKNILWNSLADEPRARKVDVHDVEASPFDNRIDQMDWLADARIFTFVRNPFVRVVSAYLNKIADQKPIQWSHFVRRYGVDSGPVIGFDAFIKLISEDAPERLDPHWRPQHLNLMYPFVQPNMMGKLERMDDLLPQVLERYLGLPPAPVKRKSRHGTNAGATYLDYFRNRDTLDRVLALYAEDFRYFGYATDLDAPVEGTDLPPSSDHRHDRLAALSDFRRAGSASDRADALSRLDTLVQADAMARDDGFVGAWLANVKQKSDAKPVKPRAQAGVSPGS